MRGRPVRNALWHDEAFYAAIEERFWVIGPGELAMLVKWEIAP